MSRRTFARWGAATALAAVAVVGPAAVAEAHSLDSTTISVHVGDDSADATLTVAAATVEEAMGVSDPTAAQVRDYLADHLEASGSTTWSETWSTPQPEDVEGIASYVVDVVFDTGDDDPAGFALTYDAVIEADPSHDAIVVLTDAGGDVSTAGTITADHPTLGLGSMATGTDVGDAVAQATTPTTAAVSGAVGVTALGVGGVAVARRRRSHEHGTGGVEGGRPSGVAR